MAFFSSSLCALTRTAHHIRITSRFITTGRPYTSPYPAPLRARPHIEHLNPPKPSPADPNRRATNRQIPFAHVYVLDPSTNKRSPAKQSLASLLETRGRRVVELVTSSPDPMVRVTTRDEVEARYREMRRAARRGARVGGEYKEVQLTWGVARADLEHKLRKAMRDLEKDYRVVVAVNMKRGQRPSSQRELVAFADEISTALGEVGRECKEREITQRSMTLSFRKTKLDENAS